MNSPRLSVVIPVYNAEKYLCQCLDSVLAQPMRDIEIICVNDGSTDSSLTILNDYAYKDSRVHVVNQENMHVGIARNNGLKLARGEYVHFMDADDYLMENAYEVVYEEAKRFDADNLKFRAHTIDHETGEYLHNYDYNLLKIPQKYFGKAINFIDYPEAFTLYNICYPAWSGLYKRSFMKNNKIQFDRLCSFEDHIFYYMVLMNANIVVYSDNYVLTYRKNIPYSLASSSLNHFECIFDVYRILDERTHILPDSLRYLILSIELKALSNLHYHLSESGQNLEYINTKTHHFLENMDTFDFTNIISTEVWNYNQLKYLADAFPLSLQKSKTINKQIVLLKKPYYEKQFPFNLVKKEDKIAIYGAGGFGNKTVLVMDETNYGKPNIWADRNYKQISVDGYIISSPSEINKHSLDYVIIAIEDKDIIMDVNKFLLNNGIPQNKIIWRDSELNVWVRGKEYY